MALSSDVTLWDNAISPDFQNTCPRKCYVHFLRTSTEMKYYLVLLIGAVSASVLIPTPHTMACEHGQKTPFLH